LLSEGESTEAEPVRSTEHMTRGRKGK
jgi:hypothetical protein